MGIDNIFIILTACSKNIFPQNIVQNLTPSPKDLEISVN